MSESQKSEGQSTLDASEIADQLRELRRRFGEFRGRL